MKLYTVAVYTLRMCLKEDNSVPKYFNGDTSREIISIAVLIKKNVWAKTKTKWLKTTWKL